MYSKTLVIGHVGRDPEIRRNQVGTRVASFSLATSETWKDKGNGERRQYTDWHRIVVYNDSLATVIEKYIRKGTMLLIEGKTEARKYTDQTGKEQTVTEIVLRPGKGVMLILNGFKNEAGEAQLPTDEDMEAMLDDHIPG